MDGSTFFVNLPSVVHHPVGYVLRREDDVVSQKNALPLQVVQNQVVQRVQHLQAVHLKPQMWGMGVDDDV
eukprot:5253175-Pyramimonas_sp.AAC.2